MKNLTIALLILIFIAQTAYCSNNKIVVKDRYNRTVETRVGTQNNYKSYDRYNRYSGKTVTRGNTVVQYDRYGRIK